MAISPYSTAAQVGESYNSLRFDSKSAQDYLSGSEQAAYSAASRGLGLEPNRNKKGNIKHPNKVAAAHSQEADKIQRLRDVASSRAFGDYSTAIGEYSKPWKVQTGPGGLISAEDVKDTTAPGGDRSFGSLDLLTGKRMRETLTSMTQPSGGIPGVLDPALMGSPDARNIQNMNISGGLSRPGFRGTMGKGGQGAMTNQQRRAQKIGIRRTSNVADAERVYTGMGGYNWANRAPDFGNGF